MNSKSKSLLRLPVSFFLGMIIGGSVPTIRYLIRGNSDPINSDPPFLLAITSFVGAAAVVFLWRCPINTAIGVYGALMVSLLLAGGSEYPLTAMVASLVHGFVPALAGGIVAYGLCASWSPIRRTTT